MSYEASINPTAPQYQQVGSDTQMVGNRRLYGTKDLQQLKSMGDTSIGQELEIQLGSKYRDSISLTNIVNMYNLLSTDSAKQKFKAGLDAKALQKLTTFLTTAGVVKVGQEKKIQDSKEIDTRLTPTSKNRLSGI